MAKDLTALQQQADTIRNEKTKNANTAERIGGMFADILDFINNINTSTENIGSLIDKVNSLTGKVESAVSSINGKQDKLTEGDNITIEETGRISALGGLDANVPVVQNIGRESGSEAKVMSQKSVTEELDKIKYDGYTEFVNNSLPQNLLTNATPYIIPRCMLPFGKTGVLKRIFLKNLLTEKFGADIIRQQMFFIVKIADGTATVKHIFYATVQGGKHTYENGVDFNTEYIVSEDEALGFYNDGNQLYYKSETSAKAYPLEDLRTNLVVGASCAASPHNISISIGYELREPGLIELDNTIQDITTDKDYIVNSDLSQTESAIASVRCTKKFMHIGKIEKIYLKNTLTTGFENSVIRQQKMFIAEISDNKAVIKKTFFVSVKGATNEYTNGADFNLDYIVRQNEVLGFYNDTHTLFFASGQTGDGYLIKCDNAEPIEGDVFDAEEQTNIFSIGYKLKTLNIIELSEKESGGEESGAVKKLTPNYVIPNVDELRVDSDNYNAVVKTGSSLSSSYIILIKGTTAWAYYLALKVDFESGKMGFLSSYNGSTENYFSSVSFTVKTNTKYYIESIKTPEGNFIGRITNMFTMESTETSVDSANDIGVPWGKRSCKSNNVTVIKTSNLSTQPYACRALIIGDSFIEGNSIKADKDKRYCYLMKQKLNGSMFVCGQGGAVSSQVNTWLSYLKEIVCPDYVILAMGMNDTSYSVWLTNTNSTIELIKGIYPSAKIAFVTVTPAGSNYANSEHVKMNEWIRNSGYSYLDAAELISLNNDGVTMDTSKLLSDQVHPTVSSHELIYKRSLIDFAELYSDTV